MSKKKEDTPKEEIIEMSIIDLIIEKKMNNDMSLTKREVLQLLHTQGLEYEVVWSMRKCHLHRMDLHFDIVI